MKYIWIVLFLVGCQHEQPAESIPIERQGIIHYDVVESELIQWKGEVLTVLFHRNDSDGSYVEIYNGVNQIQSFLWPYGLGSAIVTDKVCLFGSTDWSKNNSVYKTCLDDDLFPVDTVHLFDGHVYNTSAVWDGSRYIMAYETRAGVPFSIQFKESTDLESWTDISSIFKPEKYAAAPHIKYVDGEYVLFYLDKGDKFITRASVTKDFITFTDLPKAILTPTYSEGKNASDISVLEINGEVLMTYADGDQKTWGNVRQAIYRGTLKDMINY